MNTPQEICLEELGLGEEEECFVRCVALPGAQPGLALDREGAVKWMPEEPADYALCVSEDGKLVLLRSEGAGPMSVERGHRSLVAPPGQPVVLLDQDLLLVDGRRLRVHVHGEAHVVYPPERHTRSSLARLARAAAVAAALALGGGAAAAATAGGGPGSGTGPGTADGAPAPIEVRTRPPVVARPSRPVECSIDRQEGNGKTPLIIHATCSNPKGLAVGRHGSLYDTKSGQFIKNGSVRIKSLSGSKVVAEAMSLKRPVSNAKLRFFVYDD